MLGKIRGKSSTNEFWFLIEKTTRKFQYIKASHPDGYHVLAQVVEIETTEDRSLAKCNILGFRNDKGVLKSVKYPLEPGTDVEIAEDEFIQTTLGLNKSKYGAYIGKLEGKDIKVYLDLNRLLTRHCSILAKTGSGKSFAASVLIEEIMERNVPVVIIDPHGEYGTLKFPNDETEGFERFDVKAKGYKERIIEFSPDIKKNPNAKQLTLSSNNLTGKELMHLLPAKLSGVQIGMLYSAIKEMGDQVDFDTLLFSLQQEEINAKWSLINIVEYLKNLNIFSKTPTSVQELVQPTKGTVINLKGVPEEIQEMIVYKIIRDLFDARKNNEIPPFFLVIEESHNFCPERNFKEAKSSSVIRSVASEGRKFGLGLAVITQRPARLDKNVLSQCNTQIILKLTNPNDLKSISSSVEGVTAETEDAIKNLYIGTAMVVGVVDMPLFVDIRPRMSKHGGDSINVLETFAELSESINSEVLNLIKPNKTLADYKIETGSKNATTILIPCYILNCTIDNHDFNLLININSAELITDIETAIGASIVKNLKPLTEQEEKILHIAVGLNKEFGAAELFHQSGVQFTELYDIAKTLAEKNYFIESSGKFKVSQALSFFLKLRNYTCFVHPKFSNITFDRKLEVRYDIKLITQFISKFIKINNQKEVWLVKYEG